ncbi:hypothetical protein C3489_21250 [Streptomyces sp. Ru71]|nr:hypothetical protein C3489_21250 [Streptomyces sp. Ru71]
MLTGGSTLWCGPSGVALGTRTCGSARTTPSRHRPRQQLPREITSHAMVHVTERFFSHGVHDSFTSEDVPTGDGTGGVTAAMRQ